MSQFLVNMTMFQSFIGAPNVDGVYWTLALELKFYFLIFLILILNPKQLRNAILLWPIIIGFLQIAGVPRIPLLGGFFSFFAGGAIIADISRQGMNKKNTIPLLFAFFCCIAQASTEAVNLSSEKGVYFSPLVASSAVTCFFALLFAQNSARIQNINIPGSQLAGQISYPLYLIHAHIGYMVISKFGTPATAYTVIAATAGVAVATATLINFGVERKPSQAWARFFQWLIERPIAQLERAIRTRQLASANASSK